jgi:hypothetical protein
MRAAVVLAVVFALAAAGPAHAVDAWQFDESGVAIADHQAGQSGDGGDPGVSNGGAARQLYTYWAIGWDGDRFCRIRHVTADADLAAAYNFALHRDLAAANAPGGAAECPPGTPTAPAPNNAPTPDQLARDFWDVRVLPAPDLKMQPDYAVTGKRAYLQIANNQAAHFDVADPLGPPIGIDATSTYQIDWGDGTATTTTTSQGGPWPNGDVSHVYTTTARARIITVTQQWSATWRAGGQQGVLDNLRTQGTLTIPVTEVQAVRG